MGQMQAVRYLVVSVDRGTTNALPFIAHKEIEFCACSLFEKLE